MLLLAPSLSQAVDNVAFAVAGETPQLRTFSGMMLRECGKAGMKPVCEDPSVCKKDAKARSALLRSWAYFQAPFQTRMSLSAC